MSECPTCKGICRWCEKEYADCECSHDTGDSWACDECNDWGFVTLPAPPSRIQAVGE